MRLWHACNALLLMAGVVQCRHRRGVESDALAALYKSTNGADWGGLIANEGWLNGDPCLDSDAAWAGVTCNARVVQALHLAETSLTGTLPTEIGLLTNLAMQLSLEGNTGLSGTLPTEMGLLTSLASISLGECALSGTLPTQIGNTRQLRSILLEGNAISGTLPSELGRLGRDGGVFDDGFTLSRNRFSGTLPADAAHFPLLGEDVFLSGNRLSGSLPTALWATALSQTKELSFHGNRLSGSVPSQVAQLRYMTTLLAHGNALDGPLPAELAHLQPLGGMQACVLTHEQRCHTEIAAGRPASCGANATARPPDGAHHDASPAPPPQLECPTPFAPHPCFAYLGCALPPNPPSSPPSPLLPPSPPSLPPPTMPPLPPTSPTMPPLPPTSPPLSPLPPPLLPLSHLPPTNPPTSPPSPSPLPPGSTPPPLPSSPPAGTCEWLRGRQPTRAFAPRPRARIRELYK